MISPCLNFLIDFHINEYLHDRGRYVFYEVILPLIDVSGMFSEWLFWFQQGFSPVV